MNRFLQDIIEGFRLSVKGNRNKRLTLITLLCINTAVLATLWIGFEAQKPAKADLELVDFYWSNHSADSNFNTSYVSVQGIIRNLGLGIAGDVDLVIEIYVDYQCGHHMDALIKREILSVGSIDKNCSKEFRFYVPYSANSTLPYFFRNLKYNLVSTT